MGAGRLDHLRRSLGLTVDDCWATYFGLGGSAEREQLADYLAGRYPLPDGEIDILVAALTDQPGAAPVTDPTPIPGELAARVDSLVAQLRPARSSQRGRLMPLLLRDVHLAVLDGPIAMRVEAMASTIPAPLVDSATVLRIDGAEQTDWEIHPRGQEVLVLLAGSVEVVTTAERRAGSPRQTMALTHPEQAVVIPQATWHQHRATAPGTSLLYLTPRQGTVTTPPT